MPSPPKFRTGNTIGLLVSGAQFFPALLAAIDGAQRDVSIETYMFEADATGKAVMESLERAAERGVSVRLHIDGFGSRDFPADWRVRLESVGAAVLVFRPELTRWNFRKSRLRRLHRKIAMIDGITALVGGLNVIDDLNGVETGKPRFDVAVQVEGPLVADVYEHVQRLWRHAVWLKLKTRVSDFTFACRTCAPDGGENMEAAFVLRDNIKHRRDIEDEYLAAIQTARREVIIACAYFLAGRRFRRELVAAAERGVRVVLLLQGLTDHRWLQLATRAFYEHMLDRGVEIYEYSRSELHAKAAVVDGRWATVGSSNLDPFSLVMAREANVVVRDERFAKTLRAAIESAIKEGAQPVRRMLWKHRPLWERAMIWVGYGLARLAMGLLGLRGF